MRDWQGIYFHPFSWLEIKMGGRMILGLFLLGLAAWVIVTGTQDSCGLLNTLLERF